MAKLSLEKIEEQVTIATKALNITYENISNADKLSPTYIYLLALLRIINENLLSCKDFLNKTRIKEKKPDELE